MVKWVILMVAGVVGLAGAGAFGGRPATAGVSSGVTGDAVKGGGVGRMVRMNEIQVIGSHNSYKQAMDPGLKAMLTALGKDVEGLDYAHPRLMDQLNLGLRNLELDVFNDPEGGRFASPLGLRLLADSGQAGRAYDPEGEMRKPGFKLMHVQDIDFRSHHFTLVGALKEMRAWSERHADHVPVIVLMNLKSGTIGFPGETVPLGFDEAAIAALEAEILGTLGRERLLLPDDVRGDSATLREAVMSRGWPKLEASRGRFVFVMDEGDPVRGVYLQGAGNLAGRVFFPTVGKDHPAAGIMVINDPVKRGQDIRDLVREGFIVRTRADAGTTEMRKNDRRRFEAAMASGAQVISTDYYIADWRVNPEFEIRFAGGGYERPNPVTGRPDDGGGR